MEYENSVLKKLGSCIDLEISPTQLLSKSDIRSAALSQDYEVRWLLAKTLIFESNQSFAIDTLCILAEDNEMIVRAEAIDTLSSFCDARSFSVLCTALCDESEVVRLYAAIGVGIVGEKLSYGSAVDRLVSAQAQEKSSISLVGIYEGLYILGHHESLVQLFVLFQEEDYHVKCAVLHALDELINTKNYDKIFCFIHGLDTTELPVSVIDTLTQVKQSVQSVLRDD